MECTNWFGVEKESLTEYCCQIFRVNDDDSTLYSYIAWSACEIPEHKQEQYSGEIFSVV